MFNKTENILIVAMLAAALCLSLLLFALHGCDSHSSGNGSAPPPQGEVRGTIGPEDDGSLLYEQIPFPGFTDYISQVDYALSQSCQRLSIPAAGLKVLAADVDEHNGYIYQTKHIAVLGIPDVPQFVQALRDSLLAWAGRAALVRLPGGEKYFSSSEVPANGFYWQIILDGVTTHYLFFSSLPAGEIEPDGPKIVIVIDDIGESMPRARRLLALDYPVTFAIWPYSTHAGKVAELAHSAGAEIIIHQPMEPEGYPRVKPGKGVLLTGMSEQDIRSILEENITKVPYAIGMNNHMGSRLTQNGQAMNLVASVLKEHGFYMLDSLTHPKSRFATAAIAAGGPAFKRDIFLDVEADKDKVLAQLRKAERIASVKGQAIAIGHPLAATLDALEEWQKTRNTNIRIVRMKDLTPL